MRFSTSGGITAAAIFALPQMALAQQIGAAGASVVAPATWFEALLAGLANPVIGGAHLAFIIVIALVATVVRDGLPIAVRFGAAVLVGSLAHRLHGALPLCQVLVAASVLVAGVTLVVRRDDHIQLWSAFAVAAGLVHGCALGGAIADAGSGPVLFYLLGLGLAQVLIMLPVMAFAELALIEDRAEELKVQAAGGAAAALGIVFVASAMTSA